jgi:replicative superfamily II helicase
MCVKNDFIFKILAILKQQVHLLNEEQRGPTLEAVVSRMKTVRGAICVTQRQKQEQQQNDLQTLV